MKNKEISNAKLNELFSKGLKRMEHKDAMEDHDIFLKPLGARW